MTAGLRHMNLPKAILSLLLFCWPLLATAQQPAAASGDSLGLPHHQSYVAVGWVVLSLAGLTFIANQAIDLYRKLSPKETPPAHEKYATKADLQALSDAVNEEMSQLSDGVEATCTRIEKRFEQWLEQLDAANQTRMHHLDEWKLGVERTLGRIEHQHQPRQRPH